MPDLPVHYFRGHDGTQLAYRETGQGRPVILIHGYFSNATVNWVNYGHAAAVAGRGFRVILPDLRGHGDSAKPHEAAAYPPDILADDGFALIEHLGLISYALGGYSLGARTTIRMLARGAAPSRAVIAGMGLDGVLHASGRNAHFRSILTQLGTFDRRSPEGKAEAFLKSTGETVADLLLRVRLNLTSMAIQQRVLAGQTTEAGREQAIANFVTSFRSRWRAQTYCLHAFATRDCGTVVRASL